MAQSVQQNIDIGLIKVEKSASGGRQEYKGVLVLESRKGFRGGIRSGATVMWARNGMMQFEMCGDFSVCLRTRQGTATQKAINTQHSEVFTPAGIAEILVTVAAYYEGKPGIEAEDKSLAAMRVLSEEGGIPGGIECE